MSNEGLSHVIKTEYRTTKNQDKIDYDPLFEVPMKSTT